MTALDLKAIQLDALSKMRKAHVQSLKGCPDCAKHRRKLDIIDIRLAENMRGIDEYESSECVIVKKDRPRKHLTPSQRRDLRRSQSYLFGDYRG